MRSQITSLKPLLNAHALNVHPAFSSVSPCSIASHYPCKGLLQVINIMLGLYEPIFFKHEQLARAYMNKN